jgi:hypothetical protein
MKGVCRISRDKYLPSNNRGIQVPKEPTTIGGHLRRRRLRLRIFRSEATRRLGVSACAFSKRFRSPSVQWLFHRNWCAPNMNFVVILTMLASRALFLNSFLPRPTVPPLKSCRVLPSGHNSPAASDWPACDRAAKIESGEGIQSSALTTTESSPITSCPELRLWLPWRRGI